MRMKGLPTLEWLVETTAPIELIEDFEDASVLSYAYYAHMHDSIVDFHFIEAYKAYKLGNHWVAEYGRLLKLVNEYKPWF